MKRSDAPAGFSVNILLTVMFIASAGLFTAGLFLPVSVQLKTFINAACAALVCYDLVIDAVVRFLRGRRLDPNILIFISTIGLFIAGVPAEAAAAVLLYKAGLLFRAFYMEKYGLTVGMILDQRPEAASAVVDGAIARTPAGTLAAGDVISVSPGERVALDGIVISGQSEIDASVLTGAREPRPVGPGSPVTGGSLNLTSVLNIRVTKAFDDGDATRVLEYVNSAGRVKSELEKRLGRIARIYTPSAIGAAVLVGLLVPLIGRLEFGPWLRRGLTLLLLSTFSGTFAAIAQSFVAGIGGAALRGIVFKGAGYMDTLARATSVMFSKTGTLTTGRFRVTDVNTYGLDAGRLMTMAAYAEYGSRHPMADGIIEAADANIDRFKISNYREYRGLGVEADIGGVLVSAGNAEMMAQLGITPDLSHTEQSVVYVAINGKYVGRILMTDDVKPDAKKAIRDLHLLGIDRIAIFTGDKKEAAAEVAGMLGITEFYAECPPEEKLKKLKVLMEMQLPGDKLVYVGDGDADAPVMSASDIGIVLGGFAPVGAGQAGSQNGREDADLVIMTGQVSKVPEAISLARGTNAVVRQNLFISLAVRAVVILLVLLGLLPVWGALLAETAAGVLTMLHSARAAGLYRMEIRRARARSRARARRRNTAPEGEEAAQD
jgi:Cd2+/Zn2+-exporting ATPase